MKKFALILAGTFLLGAGLSSCKKCVTCTYNDGTDDVTQEYCSKNDSERAAWQLGVELEAAFAGDTTVVCVED